MDNQEAPEANDDQNEEHERPIRRRNRIWIEVDNPGNENQNGHFVVQYRPARFILNRQNSINLEDLRNFDLIRVEIESPSMNLNILDEMYQFSDEEDDVDEAVDELNDNSNDNNDQVMNSQVDDHNSRATTNYDISLPIAHSYLGGLDNVQCARRLFTPGSKIRLKTFYLNGIFLFPGQEIPLTFSNNVSITFIKGVIESDSRTFGIRIGLLEDRFGVTAEIRSYSFKDEYSLTIKVQGRQRFSIIEDANNSLGEYEPNVLILPDVDMFDFYRPMVQIERHLSHGKMPFLTPWTRQALDQLDNRYLLESLKSILMKIFESRIKNDEFSYPVDAIAFSYFVLMTIPFPDVIKTRLLKIDCVNLRLRLEYSLLKENFRFICGMCCLNLCDRDSFLVMSKGGTSGTFVNTHGIIHELYTFSSVQNIHRVSQYSEEFSWFPNYGWIIINCRRCRSHLGWEFQTKKVNIYPKKFWALTKNSIRLAFQMNNIQDESILKMFEQALQTI